MFSMKTVTPAPYCNSDIYSNVSNWFVYLKFQINLHTHKYQENQEPRGF